MRPIALLMTVFLAGCGSGVDGIAVPPPMDMTAIVRPTTPNTGLAAPASFVPTPDIVTETYAVPADELFQLIVAVALANPRTFLLIRYDGRMQAHFVARSAVFGFPDTIALQVTSVGPRQSGLVLWSHSVYGSYDFGVNRKRVSGWLAALADKAGAAGKRPAS